MATTAHVRTDAAVASPEQEASTRAQVVHLVVSQGPVAAAEIAAALGLTTPAVRRHLVALEADGQIVAREAPTGGKRPRGRPARTYVATESAHDALPSAYSELALQALDHLRRVAGAAALGAFAHERSAQMEDRYAAVAAEPDPAARAAALADLLDRDGYEATVRPVPGTETVQLCQGHCPVQHVAAAFPQLCEAEAEAFSRLLGVHVQRLATLARGGHVCTTNVPTVVAVPGPTVVAVPAPTTAAAAPAAVPTSPILVEGPR